MARKLDYDQLTMELSRYLTLEGPSSGVDARTYLGISQPVLSRLVGRMADDLLVLGRARSTRYAARRTIPSVGRTIPVWEVDETGEARLLAKMHAIKPEGFLVEPQCEDVTEHLYDDLPYFLHDLRPSGFLGRLIPRRHRELEVPPDIRMWSTSHCLEYLTRWGWNNIGNLILGEEAFRLYMANARTAPDHVETTRREHLYPRLARDILESGVAGSSAAGEQPKFLVTRVPGPIPVLVKFSPPMRDDPSRRIADLLVCEHLAHEVLRDHGRNSASSEIITAGDRIFLEVERFDRTSTGRRGLVSSTALDAEFVGNMMSWTETTSALHSMGILDRDTLREVRWMEWFGTLIANTDMHHGNLSFITRGTRIVQLAPAYDMLPMRYAPQHGQILDQPHEPAMPGPNDGDVWPEACRAALDFWSRVVEHPLVSKSFERIARHNEQQLESLANLARLLPG